MITNRPFNKYRSVLLIIVALALCTVAPFTADAQNSPAEMKTQAKSLINEQKFTEALPILQQLEKIDPNDAETQFYLGFALVGQAKNTSDTNARKALMVKARAAFTKSRDLGNNAPLVKAMIESIPPDGAETGFGSKNAEANALMDQGEALFSKGKLDEALAAYQAALKLDPKLYHAALFSGDVYVQTERYAEAEIWYQKAIAIDPNIETAYRYSATPLMKQKKYDLARDRYIEAYIVQPYTRISTTGLLQWAEVMGIRLGHPRIDIPKITVDPNGKSKSEISVNPLANDGSMSWLSYAVTRDLWRTTTFAKKHPGVAYRHSLEEEADSLRQMVKAIKDEKPKNLNPELATLIKLDEDGLLEAYILLGMPDEGISADHAEYLKNNREKLRQYVVKYVIGQGK
jgi:tetratricopeptide (TPR) repeat protein